MESIPCLHDFRLGPFAHVTELSLLSRLGPHSEASVRLSYRRSVRAASDPFRRAVHCVLGACDPLEAHSEVASSLDDYLWIKLSQIREDGGSSDGGAIESLSLAQLQHLMSEEYGEAHFNAYEQPVLYFQVSKEGKITSN